MYDQGNLFEDKHEVRREARWFLRDARVPGSYFKKIRSIKNDLLAAKQKIRDLEAQLATVTQHYHTATRELLELRAEKKK